MDHLLLMNPRAAPRRRRKRRSSGLSRGPKRLGNLPPALRAYWRRVRGTTRRIANPRRKTHSRGTAMAVRRRPRVHHRRRRRISYRAKRAAARRMRAMRMTNPRRRVRHHYQRRRLRNPRSGGGAGFSKRGIIHMATGAGVGMIGAVGLDYLWQYLSSNVIPAQYQTGYLGTGVKAAAAVGAGWLASKVVSKQAAAAGTIGALTVIAYQLVHQMIATTVPTAAIASTTTTATPTVSGLRAYMRPSSALGWVSPGTPLRGLGRMGAYMPAGNMPPAMNRPGGSVSMSGLAMPGGY